RNFLKKHLEVKIGERAFRNFISKIKKELTRIFRSIESFNIIVFKKIAMIKSKNFLATLI
ncbi:MAG: hypothetical protein U9P73_09105, partial [Candidatus Cloacimonadota bacterium]|nr:hypothetical protein [Candidatus Cloacimonadota bacterium]